MKLRILLIWCLVWSVSFTTLRAQSDAIVVSVIIPPPYSPYLQDYLQYENKMVIQLQSLSTQTLSVKLIGSIEGDNGIALRTDADYMPPKPITLLPNSLLRIPASSGSRAFFDPNNVVYEGPEDLKMKILKDGILPEGTYTVCIQAVDYQTNIPLSEEAPSGCALLPISYPTPPQLVSPECDGIFDGQLPFFQWTLPGGNTGNASLVYDLYIVEWLSGSNPQDLLQLAIDYHAGNAIVKSNLTTPFYQYQPTDIRLIKGKTYLWAVKVRDRMMNITFENQGQSELCSFTIGDPFEDDDKDFLLLNPILPKDFEIVQTRTLVEGQLRYKFPGETFGAIEMVNRNLNPGTGNMPFIIGEESPFELEVLEMPVAALTPKSYLDAFPVSTLNSKPLGDIPIKLIESWVIMDCNVTYLPENGASWTVHKDVFILPDDYNTMGGAFGGNSRTVIINGLTNNGPGADNPLSMGSAGINATMYNRVLAVGKTDGEGNYSLRFTQSTPGLSFTNYPGQATIYQECESVDVPEEENVFVHPLDIVSNPGDVISNPVDLLANPPGMEINNVGMQQNVNGNLNIPGGQQSLRSGTINSAPGQEGYKDVEINGGHLYKVLRLEVASPFYYSPDLIFWTHPGDTLQLPDQVAYVKSFDLDLRVVGGRWENNENYQAIDEGEGIPHTDILFSRHKSGLPTDIPIEEGQGLRDFAGEPDNDSGLINQNDMMIGNLDVDGEYDSVSVMRTLGDGDALFTRLVAGHAYYVRGDAPLDGGINYQIPLMTSLYQVFEPEYCEQNLDVNLNSFCQHKPILISDTLTAYPRAPRVFGFVVTSTGDDKQPLANVLVTIKRMHNYQVHETYSTYSDYYGYFQFSNLPVDPDESTDYKWQITFELAGYSDRVLPENNILKSLRPGQQWDLNDVEMVPLGLLSGFIQDEDGKSILALVRLADGPHVQTTLGALPQGIDDFCGDINGIGDAMDEDTRLFEISMNNGMAIQNGMNLQQQSTQMAKFNLPAQSGNQKRLVIIPLAEQYFQDTCYVDVEDVPYGQIQSLGKITVKEKLHRAIFHIKGPNGENVQARISVDENVRQTNTLGTVAFRFASPEINYRVRIDPELASLVPVDTIMRIPISKEYVIHNITLKEGRKLKVLVIRDQSGQQQQSSNPIPIAGAIVQTLLSSSPSGNSYIQCITGADGICTLEGVPTGPSTVEVTAWKEDDTHLYIGKTVSVSTSRPVNPPFQIALKYLGNITIPDIWGFPTAITGVEIKTGQGGTTDTLFEGFLTELPENARFKSKYNEVRIPYPKIKFKYSGQHADDGRKIMEPVNTGITLQQSGAEVTLYNQFDVMLKPKRVIDGASTNKLSLQKTGTGHGKIEGVVETELSSFNFSYNFDGKFYLGSTPTEYNITVFNTGMQFYNPIEIGQAIQPGQEPEPGPNDFYLMDIGAGNRPRSHAYQVFQFPATSDSSRSFVSSEAFYIHTILHTDIDDVSPRDLELSIGKIVVTPDDIHTGMNGTNRLDFKMGKLWRYYSTTPFHYDPDLGGITVSTGFIQTGQVDVPVNNPVIQPYQLIMSDVGSINKLTLSGIKDVILMNGVNVVLSKGNSNIGWKLSVRKLDDNGVFMEDAIVAEINNLDLLRAQDKISIKTILLNSEDAELDLTLQGVVRPYDIADFTVTDITTGQGYFILSGNARLGRSQVRVPGLQESVMLIKYQGSNQNPTGQIISSYAGLLETYGQVSFRLDPNSGNATKQYYKNKHFYSTGVIRVYENGKEFLLNGILEVDYNFVKLHIIDKDLNIQNLDYTKVDQAINFGGNGKKMLVRSGSQTVDDNQWEALSFKANMSDFEGLDPDQQPITFVVSGAVNATDANLSVDKIDLGFAAIQLTYDFQKQSLFGAMDFDPPPPGIVMGPVTVDQIQAQILVDPDGFLFAAAIDGSIAAGAFNATLGFLLGSHTNIPQEMVAFTMQYAKNQNPPETLADRELNGFFITGRVDLIDAPMTEVNLVFFSVAGGASVGFDARFYMDFAGANDESAFGFGALAFAGAMVQASILIPPVPCVDPSICLAAEVQLLLEAELHRSGGQWELSGHGCGSLSFSGSICGISESFGGKVDILFSSEHDPEIDAALGETCAGGSSSEYTCD
ncbi:MAG: hypothetical protein KBA14_04220 [Saprospiraceae bacterium]|nr:hypothetical protein [Saprospiraceae bacterium]